MTGCDTDRLERLARELQDAVHADLRPIVLKLSMALDGGRKPKGLEPSGKYHLITLHSTAEYVALRRAMERLGDPALDLAGRLEVSYGQQRIPHAEFVLDGDTGEKLAKAYDRIGCFEESGRKAMDDFPRVFIFKRTEQEASYFPRGRAGNFIASYGGEENGAQGVRKLLLKAHLCGNSEEIAVRRRELIAARGGFYTIGRLWMDRRAAYEEETQRMGREFAGAAIHDRTRPSWLCLYFDLRGSQQIDARPSHNDRLPVPAGGAGPAPAPEITAPPRQPYILPAGRVASGQLPLVFG